MNGIANLRAALGMFRRHEFGRNTCGKVACNRADGSALGWWDDARGCCEGRKTDAARDCSGDRGARANCLQNEQAGYQ
jgi:hypothetical protein